MVARSPEEFTERLPAGPTVFSTGLSRSNHGHAPRRTSHRVRIERHGTKTDEAINAAPRHNFNSLFVTTPSEALVTVWAYSASGSRA